MKGEKVTLSNQDGTQCVLQEATIVGIGNKEICLDVSFEHSMSLATRGSIVLLKGHPFKIRGTSPSQIVLRCLPKIRQD